MGSTYKILQPNKIQGMIVLVANKCYLFLVSIYRIANNRFPQIMKNQLFSREQENKEKMWWRKETNFW
jgi:hypothetical protein